MLLNIHRDCLQISLLILNEYINFFPPEITTKPLAIRLNSLIIRSEISEAVTQMCSVKKMFLEISQNSHEKKLCQSLLFCIYSSETLYQISKKLNNNISVRTFVWKRSQQPAKRPICRKYSSLKKLNQ